jgi:hypothetical protein
MKKEILCHECRQPITNRRDLAVVSKSFIPFHKSCYANTKKHRTFKFFYGLYPTNGPFFWIFLIVMNLVLAIVYVTVSPNPKEIAVFAAFGNGLAITFRLISFLLYEVKLPK